MKILVFFDRFVAIGAQIVVETRDTFESHAFWIYAMQQSFAFVARNAGMAHAFAQISFHIVLKCAQCYCVLKREQKRKKKK